MIIDAHVYCFEPLDSPAGHASGKEHLKWLQVSNARHHQPAWRVRDRAPASSEPLDPDGRCDMHNLPEVNFRADHARGRLVWTVNGEDFTKQFFPPNLRGLEFTPDSLIAEMDYADIDVALLHTDPQLGRDAAYLAGCVSRYPDRLRSMAPVDTFRIASQPDAVTDEAIAVIRELGLHAIKFCPFYAYLGSLEPWDDGPYRAFWQAVTSLNVPIFFTLPASTFGQTEETRAEQIRAYLNEMKVLMRWMERYPDTVCSLTHGFPWRLFVEGNGVTVPETIWEPFGNPNCNMEVSFPIRLGDMFDYPYREVWGILEEMVEKIGADHLLWGTDMPFQNRFCTYRQSRDWIEKYCSFLGREDLAKIMGGTAARILGL